MSAIGVVIVAEIPVCTTVLAGIAGAVWRRNQTKNDARHARNEQQQDKRDEALAAHSQGLAVLVSQVNPLIGSVQGLMLRTGSLEATTAALLATVETMQAGRRHHPMIRPAPHPR